MKRKLTDAYIRRQKKFGSILWIILGLEKYCKCEMTDKTLSEKEVMKY